jgi:phosphatidylglycerophosphate synthase
VYGYNIAGGLLAQASSIMDGVDGDLARLKKMTSAFGGFMDAILDRYAEALIYSGLIMASHTAVPESSTPHATCSTGASRRRLREIFGCSC